MSHKTGHPVDIKRYPVLTSTIRYNAVDEKSIDAMRYFTFDFAFVLAALPHKYV